jgi:hypothetical protein
MRTRQKFLTELLGYSLKNVRRLEVKFDPFHPNAPNVREFWAGITDKKALKTNPELVIKTTIVSDQSDPMVRVEFVDNHKLILNGKYLESPHFLQLIRQFGVSHQDGSREV